MVDSAMMSELIGSIEHRLPGDGTPLVVALDGRSGAGKPTLAAEVARRLHDCVVIEGD